MDHQSGARQYEDIQPAIVVEIDECDAAAHRFDDVVAAVRVTGDHRMLQSGLDAYIGESRMKRQSGRRARRAAFTLLSAMPLPCAVISCASRGEPSSDNTARRV